MPKNKGKGGKNRKRGKNEADDEKRELIFKEDGQEYAQVQRMLGNGRCEATCIDGTKRLCHIRGKMHKKVWIAAGDIVLVGLRDYQNPWIVPQNLEGGGVNTDVLVALPYNYDIPRADDKADVILKYMPDEARLLKAYGELPENIRLNEGVANVLDEEDERDVDDYIEFEDEDIDRI
ncbi:Eukaryotic translation initiation factor 1A, X-chromosomal [Capsicum annuum]|nr:Eukaryotic translation initiation factor 1A, X-chromosomal [Capsicum annuum]